MVRLWLVGSGGSVSNRVQYDGMCAPGLIDRGTHQTVSITYHYVGSLCYAQGIGGILNATEYYTLQRLRNGYVSLGQESQSLFQTLKAQISISISID